MAKKLYSFKDHPEHEKQLKAWADKWIANALSTKPMDDTDKAAMLGAVDGLYRAAKLETPRVIFSTGPISGAIAAGIASGIWWLRENPTRHQAIFGRTISEAELMAVIPAACSRAMQSAIASTRGEPVKTEPQPPISAATYAATYDATRAATDDATRAATYAATDAATDAALIPPSTPLIRFLLLCASHGWNYMRNGGNQWSGWASYLSFFRHVAGLELPVYDKWQHYEAAAIHGGPRFMHRRFCIVTDRPECVHKNERNRPHCETGPFTKWRDGFALYAWNGTKVPARVIENPESYTAAELALERNSEVHRALGERLGWAKYLELRGIKAIDSWRDQRTGLTYELLEPTNRMGEIEPRYLRMQSPPLNDGTQPHYVEPVDPELKTAQAARKWQFRASTHPDAKAYRHGDVVVTYAPADSLYWPDAAECNRNPNINFVEER